MSGRGPADVALARLEGEHDVDDSARSNRFLSAVIAVAESAIDETPNLTRKRPSGFLETGTLSFGESGWVIRVNVRLPFFIQATS